MAVEINNIETLLYEELKDIYDAEKQLTKALPKMAKKSSSDELREALEEHLQVTTEQVSRIEKVFEVLGQTARSKTCKGMKGLIEEGKETMEEDAADPFGDIAIIAAAQRVEHYEIAAYGTARTLAQMLGNDQAAQLLEQTLEEEKEADTKLTEITQQLLEAHGQESEEAELDEEEEPVTVSASKGNRSASAKSGTRESKRG